MFKKKFQTKKDKQRVGIEQVSTTEAYVIVLKRCQFLNMKNEDKLDTLYLFLKNCINCLFTPSD